MIQYFALTASPPSGCDVPDPVSIFRATQVRACDDRAQALL